MLRRVFLELLHSCPYKVGSLADFLSGAKKKKLPHVSPLKSFPQKARARKSLFPRDSAASLPGRRTVTPGVHRQSWGSTELPWGSKGTTHHTVPRVRDWHCLHHQIHPCCLRRKRKNTHVRGPHGVCCQEEHPTLGGMSLAPVSVLGSLLVHKSERT